MSAAQPDNGVSAGCQASTQLHRWVLRRTTPKSPTVERLVLRSEAYFATLRSIATKHERRVASSVSCWPGSLSFVWRVHEPDDHLRRNVTPEPQRSKITLGGLRHCTVEHHPL